MKKKIAIIGYGNIGKALYKKIAENEILKKKMEVVLVTRKNRIIRELCEKAFPTILDAPEGAEYTIMSEINWRLHVDLVFLAIPTADDGIIACDLIRKITGQGVPVVTCEKGALGNYFAELMPFLDKIGYSATVGGGSMLIPHLKTRFCNQIEEIHCILNGTLNYIFDGLSGFRPFGQVVSEAKRLGYAEPGAEDPLEIINGEAGQDIPKKVAVLFNTCMRKYNILRAKDISPIARINDPGLGQLIEEAGRMRYIVSFVKKIGKRTEISLESKLFDGGFIHCIDDWHIIGGFRRLDSNTIFQQLSMNAHGVNNAILTVEGKLGSNGAYCLTGPGAGAGPTTSAMINDALRLLKL